MGLSFFRYDCFIVLGSVSIHYSLLKLVYGDSLCKLIYKEKLGSGVWRPVYKQQLMEIISVKGNFSNCYKATSIFVSHKLVLAVVG